MTLIGNTNKTNIINIRYALLSIMFFLVVLFTYFAVMTPYLAANKTHLEKKITELSSDLSVIESQYIELVDVVDFEFARQLGYVDKSKDVKFVFRKNSFTALLDRNEL